MKLDVLFEDNHLLVVDKPTGIATMGAAKGKPSLLAVARDYIKHKYNKPGNVYLATVSRLDSFVSGVVVFGRTSKAAARLSEQFAQRDVIKLYWAVVNGHLPTARVLRDWVTKDEAAKKMRVIGSAEPPPQAPANQAKSGKESTGGAGQYAELAFRVLGEHGDQTLIEIDLRTGRKHQIRVQLSGRGCPIAGDKKYGSKVAWQPGAIALHAVQLEVAHPTRDERLTFRSAVPRSWGLRRFGTEFSGPSE